MNSIGLEILEPIAATRGPVNINNGYRIDRVNNVQRAPTIIEDYEIDDPNDRRQDIGPPSFRRPSPPGPLPYPQIQSFVIFLF
jgi:hypothetical protein